MPHSARIAIEPRSEFSLGSARIPQPYDQRRPHRVAVGVEDHPYHQRQHRELLPAVLPDRRRARPIEAKISETKIAHSIRDDARRRTRVALWRGEFAAQDQLATLKREIDAVKARSAVLRNSKKFHRVRLADELASGIARDRRGT